MLTATVAVKMTNIVCWNKSAGVANVRMSVNSKTVLKMQYAVPQIILRVAYAKTNTEVMATIHAANMNV